MKMNMTISFWHHIFLMPFYKIMKYQVAIVTGTSQHFQKGIIFEVMILLLRRVSKPQKNFYYLINFQIFIDFDFKLLINVSMTTIQLQICIYFCCIIFILFQHKFMIQILRQNIARILFSFLVLEIIFWFKQGAVLLNRFRLVLLDILLEKFK